MPVVRNKTVTLVYEPRDLSTLEAVRCAGGQDVEARQFGARFAELKQENPAGKTIAVGLHPEQTPVLSERNVSLEHVAPVQTKKLPGIGAIDTDQRHLLPAQLPAAVEIATGRARKVTIWRLLLAQALSDGGVPAVWSKARVLLKTDLPPTLAGNDSDAPDELEIEALPAALDGADAGPGDDPDAHLARMVWGIVLEDLAIRMLACGGQSANSSLSCNLEPDRGPVDDSSLEAAKVAILNAFRAIRKAKDSGRLRTFDAGRPEREHEIRLVLLEIDREHGLAVEAALYLWLIRCERWCVKRPVDAVIRLRDDASTDRSPRQGGLIILGAPAQASVMDEIVAKLDELPTGQGYVQFEYSRSDCRRLVASTVSGDTERLLDALCDRALDAMLVSNRPTVAWRTSFLQAIQFPEGSDLLEELQARIEGQFEGALHADGAVSHFLLPHVRKVLAPDGRTAKEQALLFASGNCRALVSLDCGISVGEFSLVFTPGIGSDGDCRSPDKISPIRAPVLSLWLHLFHDRIAMLEWVIGKGPQDADAAAPVVKRQKSFRNDEVPAWRRYLSDANHEAGTAARTCTQSVAEVLDINAHLRMTISPYRREDHEKASRGVPQIGLERENEDGVPPLCLCAPYTLFDKVENSIWNVGWFRGLLELAFGSAASFAPSNFRRTLISDRSRVIASIVLDGGMPGPQQSRQRFDWILGRLAMADEFGEGSAYDSDFARRELARAHYSRYSEFGSDYTVTDHCVAYMGFGQEYALTPIHVQHMKHQYHRLALIGFTYQAMLTNLSLQVEDVIGNDVRHAGTGTKDALSDRSARMDDLRKKVLEFTNILWFREVCSQVQGREIFGRFWQQARLDEEFGFIDEEISRYAQMARAAAQVEELRKAQRRESSRQALTLVGIPAAIYVFLITTIESGREAVPIWWLLGHGKEWMPRDHQVFPGAWLWFLSAATLVMLSWLLNRVMSVFSMGQSYDQSGGSKTEEAARRWDWHAHRAAQVAALLGLTSTLGWLLFHGFPAWVTAVPFCGALGLMIVLWNEETNERNLLWRWGIFAAMLVLMVGALLCLSQFVPI